MDQDSYPSNKPADDSNGRNPANPATSNLYPEMHIDSMASEAGLDSQNVIRAPHYSMPGPANSSNPDSMISEAGHQPQNIVLTRQRDLMAPTNSSMFTPPPNTPIGGQLGPGNSVYASLVSSNPVEAARFLMENSTNRSYAIHNLTQASHPNPEFRADSINSEVGFGSPEGNHYNSTKMPTNSVYDLRISGSPPTSNQYARALHADSIDPPQSLYSASGTGLSQGLSQHSRTLHSDSMESQVFVMNVEPPQSDPTKHYQSQNSDKGGRSAFLPKIVESQSSDEALSLRYSYHPTSRTEMSSSEEMYETESDVVESVDHQKLVDDLYGELKDDMTEADRRMVALLVEMPLGHSWLSLLEHIPVNRIFIILGSLNSGCIERFKGSYSSSFQGCMAACGWPWKRMQEFKIYKQLQWGSRILHMKVSTVEDADCAFKIYLSNGYASDYSLDHAIAEVTRFLHANQTEFVIIHLEKDEAAPLDMDQLQECLRHRLAVITPPLRLASKRNDFDIVVRDLAGQVVLVSDLDLGSDLRGLVWSPKVIDFIETGQYHRMASAKRCLKRNILENETKPKSILRGAKLNIPCGWSLPHWVYPDFNKWFVNQMRCLEKRLDSRAAIRTIDDMGKNAGAVLINNVREDTCDRFIYISVRVSLELDRQEPKGLVGQDNC